MTTAFNGIPSFFRCACQTAMQGGARGYGLASEALAQKVSRLIPYELDQQEWMVELGSLETRLRDDQYVSAWLTDHFPRCVALVPRRRRNAFFKGFATRVSELWGIDTF